MGSGYPMGPSTSAWNSHPGHAWPAHDLREPVPGRRSDDTLHCSTAVLGQAVQFIYYVEYQTGGGGTTGFTRSDDSWGVPAGGTLNVDAYGRLTHDFLIITPRQRKDMGPQVIPVSRLVSIQFGEGGIKTINPQQPATPK